jgi:hypothetical protein
MNASAALQACQLSGKGTTGHAGWSGALLRGRGIQQGLDAPSGVPKPVDHRATIFK